jgi:hypothetical protein
MFYGSAIVIGWYTSWQVGAAVIVMAWGLNVAESYREDKHELEAALARLRAGMSRH